MTDISIDVPGRPVAWERAIRTNHGRYVKPARTRDYEERVAWAARATSPKIGSAECTVWIELFAEKRLTGDPDNYSKAVLDGLQIGGMIDNDRQVRELHVAFGEEKIDLTRIRLRPTE